MKTSRGLLILGCAVILVTASLSGTPQWITLEKAEDLPEAFSATWEKGDLLVTFGRHMAIFGGVSRAMFSVLNYPIGDGKGCLLSLAPAGEGIQSDICMGSPYLTVRAKARPVVYSEVTPLAARGRNPGGIRAVGSYRGVGDIEVQVTTVYRLIPASGGRIEITSTLANSGKKPLREFGYSLYMGAGTRYSYSPFNRKVHPDLNFAVYPRPDHTLVRWNRNPVTAKPKDVLQPGESFEVRYSVFAETDTQALFERLYLEAGHGSFPTRLKLIGYRGGLYEIIIREAATGSVFFRDFVSENRGELSIPLIAGSYTAQVSSFPAVQQASFRVGAGEDNSVILSVPPTGTVHVQIQDRRGRHVPGKVTFIGLQPTRTPHFEPENPIQTGRGWESFKNSRFPGADGTDVALAAGTYMVYASRGPEFSIDQELLKVYKGEHTTLIFQIDRVLNTKGWISIDPHLHTTNSDGSMGIPERIRSLVAEGLDVAVATDHNYVNDYRPDLQALGYTDILAVICGNEITVGGMVHYNTYPVQHRPEEPLNGAIDPISDTMAELFRRSRSKDDEILIQVNHPRSGNIGYFNQFELDPEKAAFALEGFEIDFDVLEILNGPGYLSANVNSIRDWFHLLNRGYTIPLIGSSDAHGIDRGEPGYSRTYAAYKGKKGTGLDVPALIGALKEGRSFASNGPLVDVKVNRKYSLGDTLTDKDGEVTVSVRVRRAPWISLDEVRFIINGERDVILPVEGKNAGREDFTLKEKVSLTRDAYIVVEVIGDNGLYPVLQRGSRSGLREHAILPYALTNPVYIDVDGNGRFDPPWSEKIELLPEIPEKEKEE